MVSKCSCILFLTVIIFSKLYTYFSFSLMALSERSFENHLLLYIYCFMYRKIKLYGSPFRTLDISPKIKFNLLNGRLTPPDKNQLSTSCKKIWIISQFHIICSTVSPSNLQKVHKGLSISLILHKNLFVARIMWLILY